MAASPVKIVRFPDYVSADQDRPFGGALNNRHGSVSDGVTTADRKEASSKK